MPQRQHNKGPYQDILTK